VKWKPFHYDSDNPMYKKVIGRTWGVEVNDENV